MGCACSQALAQTDEERKTLRVALALILRCFSLARQRAFGPNPAGY
jgi:hypothetical protein